MRLVVLVSDDRDSELRQATRVTTCVGDYFASHSIGQDTSVTVTRVHVNHTRDYFHVVSHHRAFYRKEFHLGCLCLARNVTFSDFFRATMVTTNVFRLNLNHF